MDSSTVLQQCGITREPGTVEGGVHYVKSDSISLDRYSELTNLRTSGQVRPV